MIVLVGFDHIVLTVADIEATLAFYTALGMKARTEGGRHELHFGRQKINLHARPGQFQPAAAHPVAGSADICLEVASPMAEVLACVHEAGLEPVSGPVPRTGAQGNMVSLYLRDPDGNLVELAVYA